MPKIIDGRKIAQEINLATKDKITLLRKNVGSAPKLVSLVTGRSEDAGIYVNMQRKAADFTGVDFDIREIDAAMTQEKLLAEIRRLNADRSVTAIIVQKPGGD